MKGTRLTELKLIKVIDGDTVRVEINGKSESIRIACLDTEESQAGGGKPVTPAGLLATRWAKDYFDADDMGTPGGDVRIDIEFDTDDPVAVALEKHRDDYGRLLGYVHKGGDNFVLRAVREGWSPYFVKYGRSRLYHEDLLSAEAEAQSNRLNIWNVATNAEGERRDYTALIPWWYLRESVVEDYRRSGIKAGVKSVRLDYQEVVEAASNQRRLTLLCDLQQGINRWTGDGALIYAGSPQHKFNLWIPERDSAAAQRILALIELRYAGQGRGYVYISGEAKPYNDKPEIVLTDIKQLSDTPPR